MYHIIEAMVRWLAPILSFTADEIWPHIPGERGESVFLETWYQGLFSLDEGDRFDRGFWSRVIEVRGAVGKRLEQLRADGVIGSSLDAEVDLYCSPELLQLTGMLGSELRFVLITSAARVHALEQKPADALDSTMAGLAILATRSEHRKCARCWHHHEDVGSSNEHPDICGRCIENITTDGEVRNYA